ncbi:MAG: hypothetical protein H0V66_09435 [Bdellovibrionales bacterium]|nr:hypothetical protein [Bdellovibrionales bacterium]
MKVNADYEVELFHRQLAPVAINQSIEFFLFFLNSSPLYTQKKYSPDYLAYVASVTGNIAQIINTGSYENFWGPLKDFEKEKWWNSKVTSTELILQKGWCLDTHILNNAEDLKNINWDRELLLKDPYGMSGQKFQLLDKNMSLPERKVAVLKALQSGPQIVEPWFNRKFDFSQYIFPDNKVIAYQNQVDGKFQYKGTVFNNFHTAKLEDLSFYNLVNEEQWTIFQKQTSEIIQHYQRHPNEYGFSIDSFVYEEQGELKIRVMSEINYRRTMGRVAYELSQKFAADKFWSALLLNKVSAVGPLWKRLIQVKNVIVLSPGDSRFEIIFVSAANKTEGLKTLEQINALLPDGQFSVQL